MKMLGESVNMVVTQRIRDQVGLLIDNGIQGHVFGNQIWQRLSRNVPLKGPVSFICYKKVKKIK